MTVRVPAGKAGAAAAFRRTPAIGADVENTRRRTDPPSRGGARIIKYIDININNCNMINGKYI